MGQKIDLGGTKVFEVTFNGKDYEINEPAVKDAQAFSKAQKKKDADEMGVFIDFLSGLGLPKEVGEQLPLSKIKYLTEQLIGDLEKK